MIDYNFQGRLTYLPGGPVSVQMSAWPVAAGANWWEPSGVFTPVAAYQAKGAADLATSYVNLANPGTNDAAPGVAPTFNTAMGWIFNGTTQYLTTGVVPDNGWSMLVRFTGGAANGPWVAGRYPSATPTAGFGLLPRRGSADDRIYFQGGNLITGVRVADGIMAIANNVGYYNGVSDGAIGAWSGSSALAIFLGSVNIDGSPAIFWDGEIQAVAIYSTALDAAQIAQVSAAMAAL